MAQKKTQQYDVIVVGGGLTGMVTALALVQSGIRVAVIDRSSLEATTLPEFDGRTTALNEGSVRLFRHIGVWQAMEPYGEPMLDIRVVDNDSPLHVHYDAAEVGGQPFGYIIENRHMRQCLVEAAQQCVKENKPLSFYAPATIDSLQTTNAGATLTLAGGEVLRASLVIAADGRGSATREMAGIAVKQTPYEQTAIVCTLKHSSPHHNLAVERFMPSGPFAVLPMRNNHVSIVWSEQTSLVDDYLALPETDFLAELQQRIGGWLGDISLVGKRWSYPLSMIMAETYGRDRVALIGDAAHVIHPIAGQGVNLGYRDVAVLVELIQDRFHLGLDIGSAEVLNRYGQLRKVDCKSVAAIMHGLTHLFSNDIWPIAKARRLGLAAVNRMPFLKQLFVRHAMGTLGQMPRLMRDAA